MSIALRMAGALAAGASGGDPYYANVSLLLHGDGANNGTTFTDNSPNNFSPTVTPTIVTSTGVTPQWGTASIYGSTGYLEYAADTDFVFGAGQFTIECWAYFISSSFNIIVNTNWAANGLQLYRDQTQSQMRLETTSGSLILSTLPATGTWHYLCLQRDATNLQFYLNGTRTYNVANSINFSGNNGLFVCKDNGATRGNCYIDDLRITKGVARYTNGTTITVPTAAFPNS